MHKAQPSQLITTTGGYLRLRLLENTTLDSVTKWQGYVNNKHQSNLRDTPRVTIDRDHSSLIAEIESNILKIYLYLI